MLFRSRDLGLLAGDLDPHYLQAQLVEDRSAETCSLGMYVIFFCQLASTRSEILRAMQLPFHIQWQDLKDLFRQAGTILRADVALGADGRSRGFGTVSFAGEADAERAVRMFNG